MAALLLLTRARSNAVAQGGSVAQVAGTLQPYIRDAVVLARSGARTRGVNRLIVEADTLGAQISFPQLNSAFMRDWMRADEVSRSYATRWLRNAEEVGSARAASAATQGSLERIGVTESSEAFNSGRTAALRDSGVTHIMRAWDAESGACPICSEADGQIVGTNESFSIGEPGSVHAHCRCGWTAVGVTLKD